MSNDYIKTAPAQVRYKLKKGDGLVIKGLPYTITNDNVNDPNVLKAIARMEATTGKKHIGVTIVKA